MSVAGDWTVGPEQAEVQARRARLLVPALLATVLDLGVVGVRVLWLLVMQVVGSGLESSSGYEGELTPLRPAPTEVALAVVVYVVPLVVSAVLLALTWRARSRGDTAETWVFAGTSLLAAIGSPFWLGRLSLL